MSFKRDSSFRRHSTFRRDGRIRRDMSFRREMSYRRYCSLRRDRSFRRFPLRGMLGSMPPRPELNIGRVTAARDGDVALPRQTTVDGGARVSLARIWSSYLKLT